MCITLFFSGKNNYSIKFSHRDCCVKLYYPTSTQTISFWFKCCSMVYRKRNRLDDRKPKSYSYLNQNRNLSRLLLILYSFLYPCEAWQLSWYL